MLPASSGTPQQLRLVDIQLKSVGLHPAVDSAADPFLRSAELGSNYFRFGVPTRTMRFRQYLGNHKSDFREIFHVVGDGARTDCRRGNMHGEILGERTKNF